MPALPTATLNKIKASLADPAAQWVAIVNQSYTRTRQTATNGDPPTYTTDTLTTTTYQVRSAVRGVVLTFKVELVNGSLDSMAVIWDGQDWSTTDAALRTTIETMSAGLAAAKATALEGLLS